MKPLEGITILEFSTMITAALASMMLAEQGARVIKVEPTDAGDPMRYIGARKGDISSLFAGCNRGKESIKVDLKSEAGQAVIHEMIPHVDVVIHNFRPGTMETLNLDFKTLEQLNSRLIYMAISGFGTEGPLRRAPAYDPIIQAQCGMAATQGSDESPTFIRSLLCDKITGYTACQAVTSALFARERTGNGQIIDLSMLDSGLFFMFPDGFQNHALLDEDTIPGGLLIDILYDLTLTKDGGVTVAAANQEMQGRMLNAIGLLHLLQDERFNSMKKLVENLHIFRDLVAEKCMEYTSDELLALLREVEVPCAKCLTRDEVLAQEQLSANDSVSIVDHPHLGTLRIVRAPPRFGGKRLTPSRPTPAHGEHTDSVLSSFGVPADRIEALKSEEVIG
ncbi:MAG: carnitine dehydratase [Cellvibrionales bacterium TMED122]|nr:carnitine dehydratase [Halieaceae bacterium]OUV68942.1 MAG: carnitine dehydratase [Cellvibrionales bacterium TMED122]